MLAHSVSSSEAHALIEWGLRNSGGSATASGGEVRPPTSPPVLLIDDRRPGQVLIEGKSIRLQDKQYQLVSLLAEYPGECVPYDKVYETLWGNVVVEQNQMHFQKRRLIERIRESVPHRAELVRTVPKRGFMLDLPPTEVSIVRAMAGAV